VLRRKVGDIERLKGAKSAPRRPSKPDTALEDTGTSEGKRRRRLGCVQLTGAVQEALWWFVMVVGCESNLIDVQEGLGSRRDVEEMAGDEKRLVWIGRAAAIGHVTSGPSDVCDLEESPYRSLSRPFKELGFVEDTFRF
jgi:hypothetical protein